jgi:hypothetical protein
MGNEFSVHARALSSVWIFDVLDSFVGTDDICSNLVEKKNASVIRCVLLTNI